MWELVVTLIMYAERERPALWPAPIVAEQTVTLGPYASRAECHETRRWLAERSGRAWYADEGGNEPVGFDPRWSFANRAEVGHCQAAEPHSSR